MIDPDEGGDPGVPTHLFDDEAAAPTADSAASVIGIHIVPASRTPLHAVDSVEAGAGAGLVGNRVTLDATATQPSGG